MWKQDIEALLKVWPQSRLIKQMTAVYSGIAIEDTSGNHYLFNHNTNELKDLGKTWKKHSKGPKPKIDNRVHIKVIEGINYPYFSVEKDPEGGDRECYGMDEVGFECLKQRVHGREIAWETGWNVFAEKELTTEESEHWIFKYLEYVG